MTKKKECRWGDIQNPKNNQVYFVVTIQSAIDMLNKELQGGE
nr:MAG TPA: Protein of unknown function (DUF3095) [Caudoviricetes sp.]